MINIIAGLLGRAAVTEAVTGAGAAATTASKGLSRLAIANSLKSGFGKKGKGDAASIQELVAMFDRANKSGSTEVRRIAPSGFAEQWFSRVRGQSESNSKFQPPRVNPNDDWVVGVNAIAQTLTQNLNIVQTNVDRLKSDLTSNMAELRQGQKRVESRISLLENKVDGIGLDLKRGSGEGVGSGPSPIKETWLDKLRTAGQLAGAGGAVAATRNFWQVPLSLGAAGLGEGLFGGGGGGGGRVSGGGSGGTDSGDGKANTPPAFDPMSAPDSDAGSAAAGNSKYTTQDGKEIPAGPAIDRSGFLKELEDPATIRAFAGRMKSEVGNQGREAQVAWAETTFNRAAARGKSLRQTVTGSYFPTNNPGESDNPKFHGIIKEVAERGTNITFGATGNASGNVGFGSGKAVMQPDGSYKAPNQTASFGGERFGLEKADQKWKPKYLQPNQDTKSAFKSSSVDQIPEDDSKKTTPPPKPSDEVQKQRPNHYGGLLEMDGIKYRYGTGSRTTANADMQRGSMPYGTFDIKPGLHVAGQNPKFVGNSFYVKDMFDPKWGTGRSGMLLHSASDLDKLYTAGCIGIDPKQWPQFKAHMLEVMKKNGGKLQITIQPDGNAFIGPPGSGGGAKNISVGDFIKKFEEDKATQVNADTKDIGFSQASVDAMKSYGEETKKNPLLKSASGFKETKDYKEWLTKGVEKQLKTPELPTLSSLNKSLSSPTIGQIEVPRQSAAPIKMSSPTEMPDSSIDMSAPQKVEPQKTTNQNNPFPEQGPQQVEAATPSEPPGETPVLSPQPQSAVTQSSGSGGPSQTETAPAPNSGGGGGELVPRAGKTSHDPEYSAGDSANPGGSGRGSKATDDCNFCNI